MRGVVRWFSKEKGYGFILAGGKDYFVHFSEIQSKGYKFLVDGTMVQFEVGQGPKGQCAQKVRVDGEAPLE